MNYLSKIILQQLLPQFVEVPSQSLNLEQSGIKLSKGDIKKEKYNPTLQKIGIRIDQCSYTNIFLQIPWMEIYKKPIKITIDELRGKMSLLERKHLDIEISDPVIMEQKEESASSPSASGEYLKSVGKKLLFNMEMNINRIVFGVENEGELNLTLNIQNINIKNSKLSEDSKNITKTLSVEKMSICLNQKPLILIKGFNFCLDAGESDVKAISLINSIFINIDFKELRLIKDSIISFTTHPGSRKSSLSIQQKPNSGQIDMAKSRGRQIPKERDSKKEEAKKGEDVEKKWQVFVKVFEMEGVLKICEEVSVSMSISNLEFTQNTKIKTKTKLSLASLTIKESDSVIFGIRSSKSPSNSQYFINYSDMEEKAINNPQLRIETVCEEHICIKLYYVQLYGTERLLQLLLAHLKTIIDNVAYLFEPPANQNSSTSLTSIDKPSDPQPSTTLMTTVMIYQGMINILHKQQYYKLYLSIQYLTDNGCLYQFDTFQISIRNSVVEILKVFDSEVSITQDDIYVKVEAIQIQIWNKAIVFFKDLVEGIIGIVNSVAGESSNAGAPEQAEMNKVENVVDAKIKYLILVRNCRVILGNILPKQQLYKFIDLFQVSIKDTKIILSNNPNSVQCGAILSFIFTDQHTLLQQHISNPIQISFQNIHSKDVSIQLLNNVSLKLQSRYLKYIYNTLNNTSSFISVTNFTNRKIRIACEGCASAELEYKVNTTWFPLVGKFRFESYQGKGATGYINLDLEMDVDKQIELLDTKEHLIIRLVKTKVSSYHLLIKPSFKVLNCVREFNLLVERSKLNIKLAHHHYQKIDFDDQYSVLHKSEDIHDLEKIIDSGSESQILFQDTSLQKYYLKELVTKDNVTLFAFQSLLHKNYSCYAMKKDSMLLLMPFLSLKNNTNHKLHVVIQEKKSSLTINLEIDPHTEIIPSNNQQFDFYMRQLTIKVSFQSHQSQAYYFNTFAFLSQPHEQIIPLRSSQKGILQKRHVIIKQTAKVRSKYLEFSNPATIINHCEFDLSVKIDQRGIMLDKQILKKGEKVDICISFKNDYEILVYFQQQVETKVNVECSKLKNSAYVVSFNFCKIGDKFKNVLVLCQLSKEGECEILTFKPFITIMNLTSLPIRLNDNDLSPNGSCSLSLVINSDKAFNNRCIKLQPQTPAQMFQLLLKNMEDKNEQNESITIGGSTILLNTFLQKTLLEVSKLADKRVMRIVKDTHQKISLYVIEGVHLDSVDDFKYSLITNNTNYHYLLSEEPMFSGLFVVNQEKHPQKLNKLLIEPRTTSTIIPNSNYNILLCNEKGEKLNELNCETMELRQIQEERNVFERVETRVFQQKSEVFRGEQFKSKTIEIELSLDGELFLILHIKHLKIRRLQTTKFDVLLNELLLKDVKRGVNVVGLKQNNYAILDLEVIGNSACMIRNMFVKLGLVDIDLRKEFLFNLIRFSKNFNKEEPKHLVETRTSKESDSREQALIEVIKSKLFLIKNMFIEEFTINLNIELEALVFSNPLLMPIYKMSSTSIREKKLVTELWKFYSSALVSKFPKLSFLIQNLKHPLNIIKNIYNLRETLKSKPLEKLKYWSNASKYSPALLVNQLPSTETIVWAMNSIDRIVILSNRSLLLQQYTPIPCRSTKFPLSSIKRITYHHTSIQLTMNQNNRIQIEMAKRDQRMLNSILTYLLQ